MKHKQAGIELTLLLVMVGLPALAQDQTAPNPNGSSLGEYARQVRKTSGPAAKPKVFDNDNLPKDDRLSVVGKPEGSEEQPKAEEAPAANAANQPAADGKAATAANPGNVPSDPKAREEALKQWSDKLSQQKDQVDLMNRELDVLQREYQIRAAAIYADVGNRLRNSSDWDKQDAQYKQQIADKQKAIEDAKHKMDDLEEEARKAGVPSSVREQ